MTSTQAPRLAGISHGVRNSARIMAVKKAHRDPFANCKHSVFARASKGRTRGSAALPALFSIASGVLFSLLYINFTAIVTAKHAVEQSARTTLRCLTPTDASCTTLKSPVINRVWEWYQYEERPIYTLAGELYNYSASMYKAEWNAEIDYYEIERINSPRVEWTTYEVPVRRYYSLPPRLIRKRYFRQLTHKTLELGYKPKHEPSLPAFLDNEIEHPTLDENIDTYKSAYRSHSFIQRFNFSNFHSAHFSSLPELSFSLQADRTFHFLSDPILVPELERSSSRRCALGSQCDTSGTAGCQSCRTVDRTHPGAGCNYCLENSNGKDSFIDHAFVALKAFARVKGDRDTTQFGWGENENESDRGLYLLAFSGPRDQHPLVYNLGGRINTKIGTGESWRNLVLRGSSGSNGGTVFHEHIAVKRGGYFRIGGNLRATGGSVNGSVAVLYTFDDFEPATTRAVKSYSCPGPTIISSVNAATASCPAASECGITDREEQKNAQCDIDSSRPMPEDIPTCEQDPRRSFSYDGLDPARPFISRTLLLCVGEAPAEKEASVDNDPGDGCGLYADRTLPSKVESATRPAVCPELQGKTHERQCSPGSAVETKGCSASDSLSLKRCSWIEEEIARAEAQLRLIEPEVSGLTSLQLSSFTLSPEEKVAPFYNWESNDEQGNFISCSHRNTLHVTSTGSYYLHKSSGWHPDPSLFPFSLPSSGNPSRPPQVSLMNVRYWPKEDSIVEIEIKDGFPFKNKPEIELSPFLPQDKPELECSRGNLLLPVEERLRFWAARYNPIALDPDIRLTVTAEHVGSRIVASKTRCDSEVPDLNSCGIYHEIGAASALCRTSKLLGSFSEEKFPNGPPACESTPCYRRLISQEEISPGNVTSNKELAAQRGFNAFSALLPGARFGCEDAGCVNVSILELQPSRSTVKVRYLVPLAFPFDAIAGQKSMTIERTLSEENELASKD